MYYPIKNCSILILAAGQSKRLGKPKQLLVYEGETLLNRLIGIVTRSTALPLTVVLGANAVDIEPQITYKDVELVINEQWQEGMASSIRAGLESAIRNNPQLDGIMVMVCDQPFLSANSIQSLWEIQEKSGLPIAACYYSGVIGTPALFHKSVFPDIMALNGDTGAKMIIKNREKDVAKLHFEKGMIDIDTLDDYNNLITGSL